MCKLGERSQMIYYDTQRDIKTIKTRIGDGIFTKLVTNCINGKRKLEIYNYDELLHSMEV